jgi:hypothetical protein
LSSEIEIQAGNPFRASLTRRYAEFDRHKRQYFLTDEILSVKIQDLKVAKKLGNLAL